MHDTNSEFDEEGLCFTGDSNNVLFHSSRPGAEGGSDIYFYSLYDTDVVEGEGSDEALPGEDVALQHYVDADVFTLQALTDTGETLTLLVDTAMEGILLFEDRAPSGNRCGEAFEVQLPGGILAASEQICMELSIGLNTINGIMPLISSQAEYNAQTGRTDLPTVDGVIGFRGGFVNQFVPVFNLLEFNFINGKPMGLDLQPGLSIGKIG